MQDRGQRKVKGAQAKDGEDVRRVDQERVGCDGKDRWHGIHRKNQVGRFDHDQRQEQGRCKQHPIPLYEKRLTL